MTAILIIVLFSCVALAVDLGYIIVVRNQLQAAADSAALAGASQLLDQSYLLGTQNTGSACDTAMANARTQAQAFAQDNTGGGVALTLGNNANNDPTGEIVCGYIVNPSNYSDPFTPTTPSVGPYPNSVQVTVHRDGVRNGSLALFFAPVLGIRTFDMEAKATATYQGGVKGFQIQSSGYTTCKLLPFALNVWTWSNAPTDPWYDATKPPGVVQGNGPDTFSRDPSTGAVTSGKSDGIHECKLFPLSNGNGNGNSLEPGNFGTINIGAMGNGTSDLVRVILNGPNAQDLSLYAGGRLQLDSTTHTVPLQGNTGVSAACKSALNQIIGQARILPLYSAVSGPGSNCQYTIVAFAGVTVLEAVLTGSLSSKHVTIQPCWCIDPNGVGGGSPTSSTYVTLPLALTR
jgi:Flp pilus assembly protein TadG